MSIIKSVNPVNGEVINEYPLLSTSEVDRILNKMNEGFHIWKNTSFTRRANLLNTLAQQLRQNKESLAKLISLEMGKVYKESLAEIEKCASLCEYYAENGEEFLSDVTIKTEASHSFVTYQPLGVILGVMPWNFPFWQVFRFAIPTLISGNACVLKHASNVPGSALAIENLFIQAGFPDNTFRTLLITSNDVKQVIEHPAIKAVSLTGSTDAGKNVAAVAGGALKKAVLELGGSDAYIILKDADIDYAASICVKSRLINAGQSCIAAKRFIVEENVYDAFLKKFSDLMQAIKFGDPFAADTDIGPMATHKLRNGLHKQVEISIEKGAGCILGGYEHEEGSFYPPTILTNVEAGMPAFDEELFGPVAAIIKAKNHVDAIELANKSNFGLGSAIFSKDSKTATDIAKYQIESGCCFVNDFVRSDPRLPFGGIKQSGYGRELGAFGIHEFVNIKTVYVK